MHTQRNPEWHGSTFQPLEMWQVIHRSSTSGQISSIRVDPGLFSWWYVFPSIIWQFKSSNCWLVRPFTDPCVPTCINIGVSHVKWGTVIRYNRARLHSATVGELQIPISQKVEFKQSFNLLTMYQYRSEKYFFTCLPVLLCAFEVSHWVPVSFWNRQPWATDPLSKESLVPSPKVF